MTDDTRRRLDASLTATVALTRRLDAVLAAPVVEREDLRVTVRRLVTLVHGLVARLPPPA